MSTVKGSVITFGFTALPPGSRLAFIPSGPTTSQGVFIASPWIYAPIEDGTGIFSAELYPTTLTLTRTFYRIRVEWPDPNGFGQPNRGYFGKDVPDWELTVPEGVWTIDQLHGAPSNPKMTWVGPADPDNPSIPFGNINATSGTWWLNSATGDLYERSTMDEWVYKASLKGIQGDSVDSAVIGSDGRLRVSLTDGTVIDAGNAKGSRGLPGLEDVPTDPGIAELVKAGADSLSGQAIIEVIEDTIATPVLAGQPLTVYGHSFAIVPPAYGVGAAAGWPSQLAAMKGMIARSKAIGGARMIEIATLAIGSGLPGTSAGDRHFVPGTPGVVVIEGVTNDAIMGPATAKGRLGFMHALRSLLAAVTAGQRIEANEAASTTGAWGTLVGLMFSAGSALFSATVGDTITFNVTAPAGKVYILTLVSATGNPFGSFTVQVDGNDQGIVFNGSNQMEAFTSGVQNGEPFGYSHAVVEVIVPSTGNHQLRITHTVAPSIYIDALLIPGVNQTPVVVCMDPPVGNLAAPATQAAWAANSPALHNLVIDVAAEFPSAVVAELGPDWDIATMVSTEDPAHFHPDALGMLHIASKVVKAVSKAVVRWVGKRMWM